MRNQLGVGDVTRDAAALRPLTRQRLPWILPNPTATYGDGLWISHKARPFTVTVPPGEGLSLLDIDARNLQTTLGASQLYVIKLYVENEAIDVGAGLAIFNGGRSDSIYLGVAGKPSGANNSPTGIGIDLNKTLTGTGEQASSGANQQGIQIFDWSQTNQGVGGPRGMLIQKISNLNTDHILLGLRGNRWHIQHLVKTGDAGYSGTQPIIRLADETTTNTFWTFRAQGDLVFSQEGLGLQWEMATTGHTAYIIRSGGNELKLKGGSGGIRFANQADTATRFMIADGGEVTVPSGPLTIGTNDTFANTLVQILGGPGGASEGAELRLFMSADHDGTYDYWFLDIIDDDLRIGPAGAERLRLTAEGRTVLQHDLTLKSTGVPPDPASGAEARLYVRNEFIIVQYNDGGIVRYSYLDLTDGSAVWKNDTTPPS